MNRPTHNHDPLWNDLPIEERKRLMPYQIEAQILHIHQCKSKAILAHNRHIDELNAWIKNLQDELSRIERKLIKLNDSERK